MSSAVIPEPIIVKNSLPPAIVALSADMVIRISDLEQRALSIVSITDQETYSRAEEILRERTRLEKETEEKRKQFKAPVLDLGRQIDAAAGEALAPLLAIKQTLGEKVLKFQAEENARREAARRKAEAEALERQRELQRQADEQARIDREAAAERARIQREIAAADPTQAAPPDEDEPPEVVAEVVRAPVVVLPTRTPAPLRSGAVGTRTVKKVVIFNPAAVPDEVNGVPLRILDTAAIERLAKAGLSIPGVRIELVPVLTSR